MEKIHSLNPDYLFMIEQAVKAPSGHNTQPWLFRINESNIEIHPNYEKTLPVVDPDNRELFISLGCAAENLCITATEKGYKPEVNITDKGSIIISLARNTSIEADPLFKQIAFRQTNRSLYNRKLISQDTIEILKGMPKEPGINIYYYRNGSPEFDSIANYIIRGNIQQMQDEAFRKELKSWMRFNKKHQDETNDGLSYAVFGAPNLPKFIVKPIMSKALNAKRQNNGDVKKIRSSSHFVLFTIKSNTLHEWINLGRALEHFLLKSTESGIIHAYMNQPNELKDLSNEMAKSLYLTKEYPVILLRLGYGKTMPYSKRKNIQAVILNYQNKFSDELI